MPKLYIMCGLAFSGKSTLARKIAAHTNSKLITFDALWVEKEKEQVISKDASGWRFIRQVGQEQITKTLIKGHSVVYDDNNVRFEHRDQVRDIARKLKVASIVVYLNTPIEIIKERESLNKLTGDRHEVDPVNFQAAVDQLQVPTTKESVIFFHPQDSVDNWLKSLDKSLPLFE